MYELVHLRAKTTTVVTGRDDNYDVLYIIHPYQPAQLSVVLNIITSTKVFRAHFR